MRLKYGFDKLKKCTALAGVQLNGRSRKHLFLKTSKSHSFILVNTGKVLLRKLFLEHHASKMMCTNWFSTADLAWGKRNGLFLSA